MTAGCDGNARRGRRSIRLPAYDYRAPGWYFVTMCVLGGRCLLGTVADGEMVLNFRGHVVAGAWLWLAARYPYVTLDAWQVMPNHFHGIVVLTDDVGVSDRDRAVREPPLREATVRGDTGAVGTQGRKPLGRLIGAFKTVSSAQINRLEGNEGARFWQRNYWERVIRNERELVAIRDYIARNPGAWEEDRLFPQAPRNKFNADW